MGTVDFQFEYRCSVCGDIYLNMDSFSAASYTKDGALSLTFSCPLCGSDLTITCNIDRDIVSVITSNAVDGAQEVIKKSAQEAAKHAEDKGSSSRQGLKPKGDEIASGISIQYTPIRPGSMMRFNMQLTPKSPNPPLDRPFNPTDDEKAMMEYFHRQLEEIDTVDRALEEIDASDDNHGGFENHGHNEDDSNSKG